MELQLISLLRSESSFPSSSAKAELGASGETPRRNAKHFDDILGQTLAGPLFATWTPTAPVNPVSGASSPNSAVTALDPDAKRGRKRSRR